MHVTMLAQNYGHIWNRLRLLVTFTPSSFTCRV